MADEENFRFNAKSLLLTYSQWRAPKEWVLEQLTEKLDGLYNFITVSHEFHADGGDHIHAVVSFIRYFLMCFHAIELPHGSPLFKFSGVINYSFFRKWDQRNVRFLDLEHEEFGGSHPNWKSRTLARAYTYVTKDGDFVTEGEVPARLLPPSERPLGKRDAAFAALDAQHDTVAGFMSALRQKHPYEYFTRGAQIEANVLKAKGFTRPYEPEYAPETFRIPGAIQDWLDTEFNQEVCY